VQEVAGIVPDLNSDRVVQAVQIALRRDDNLEGVWRTVAEEDENYKIVLDQ
jgi:hypothetical protein